MRVVRADLHALTPDALAVLTNRGLVKRATRELDTAAPRVSVDPDGTLHGEFADGPRTTLPVGGLDAGTCSCGAPGACRHLIGLILAYQRQPADEPTDAGTGAGADAGTGAAVAVPPVATVVDWSPGSFTDEQLAGRLGARRLAAARRVERVGYVARIRRPTAAEPAPVVELSTATVRFLVPHDLGFVHTDAATGTRDDIIALAVWAFREADRVLPRVPDAQVQVGGAGRGAGNGTGAVSGLEPALHLADTVLRDGAARLGPGVDAAIADVRRRLDAAGLRWPLLAVGDLATQLASYRERSSGYRPAVLAGLLAELHARHRAVMNGGAGLRARVLGTEEAAETPLRKARLDGLGCRVHGLGSDGLGSDGLDSDGLGSDGLDSDGLGGDGLGGGRVVEVYLAHADSATVLVLRRSWPAGNGPVVAARRVAGSSVSALAIGTVVTESAVRSASRTVRLAAGRVARTTVSASRGGWDDLPSRLVVRDLGALRAELDALPPRPVRARVAAELVRVVAVAEVGAVRYAPGEQRLDAEIVVGDGATAVVRAVHTAAAPGRLDAVAAALNGEHGTVRFVSGTVRRTGGGVEIDPLALATGETLVVPDLAAGPAAALEVGTGGVREPIGAAIAAARDVLADVAHRGLAHLPATFGDRLRTGADTLGTVGLSRIAASVRAFAAALGPDPGEAAIRAWVDAYLSVEVADELHGDLGEHLGEHLAVHADARLRQSRH